ncbi:MAG: DUF86 domain-containing protein [Flavobacteriales bacterium]
MNGTSVRYDFFLDAMLMAMKKIRAYPADFSSYEHFTQAHLVKDAVIRNFEIMGESVKHIPFSFQRKHKQLPWNHMLALRNFIVHEFFDVDDEVLWEIIQTDLARNIADLEEVVTRK